MRIQTAVPYLTEAVIDERALRILRSYESVFGAIQAPPVPIDHLAEAFLNLRIVWDAIAEDDGGKVLAYIDPDTNTICLNENQRAHFEQYFGTEAFTLAHEVGHWELHIIHDGWEQLEFFPVNRNFLCRAFSSDRLEIQANLFAASLLMPSHLVRAALGKHRLRVLDDIRELGRQFGVSQTAMKLRLQSLRLVQITRDSEIRDVRERKVDQLSFN